MILIHVYQNNEAACLFVFVYVSPLQMTVENHPSCHFQRPIVLQTSLLSLSLTRWKNAWAKVRLFDDRAHLCEAYKRKKYI